MSREQKEVRIFKFSTEKRADYWLEQTFYKFKEDVVSVNKKEKSIEFPEAVYYFVRFDDMMKVRILRPDFECSESDLYCILDDPEFHKLYRRNK